MLYNKSMRKTSVNLLAVLAGMLLIFPEAWGEAGPWKAVGPGRDAEFCGEKHTALFADFSGRVTSLVPGTLYFSSEEACRAASQIVLPEVNGLINECIGKGGLVRPISSFEEAISSIRELPRELGTYDGNPQGNKDDPDYGKELYSCLILTNPERNYCCIPLPAAEMPDKPEAIRPADSGEGLPDAQ